MSKTGRQVAFVAAVGAILCGSCAGVTPAGPATDAPAVSASAVSNTDTPQPSSSSRGAFLRGRVLDQSGKPVAGCLVHAEGDSLEYAIVSDSSGVFEYGVPFGDQVLIIKCDDRSYAEERVRIKVPQKKEFRQDFTVRGK